jgi:hypothetical protein
MQTKRQNILLGVLGVLIVVFLVWTFVLKGGDSGGGSSEEQVTATTVATAQVPGDTGVVTPGDVTADPSAPAADVPLVDEPFDPMAYRNPFERQG